jgi:hypothetical protein
MRPVEKLYEKVHALEMALYYLKQVEPFNPSAARKGAVSILREYQKLTLDK